jgi:hypothetical protein
MKKILLGLILIGLMLSPMAQAGLLIEPNIGVNLGGKFSGDTPEAFAETFPDTFEDESWNVNGNFYGLKLGYKFLGFMIGGEYSAVAGSNISDGESYNITETGAFIGYAFPFFLRIYAGPVLSSNIEVTDKEDGIKSEWLFKGGSGTRMGIGLTLLPFLSINLEVKNIKYKKFDYQYDGEAIWDTNVGSVLGITDEWADHENSLTSYLLSISLPIEI